MSLFPKRISHETGPKVVDLYFIIRVSTIVNPSVSYINCHPQLCHLHSTLQGNVKKDLYVNLFLGGDFPSSSHDSLICRHSDRNNNHPNTIYNFIFNFQL